MGRNNEKFSKFGAIAAAAGCAIGLGNLWAFSYKAGENGGGAFVLIYIICVFVLGVPLMVSEFIIGRKGKSDAIGSIKKIDPRGNFYIVGILGNLSAILIISFYSMISGWSIYYAVQAILGKFNMISSKGAEKLYNNISTTLKAPIFYQFIFLLLTSIIVILGIKKGIEKASKIMMPALFLILIILVIYNFTTPGFKEGIEFLFKPNMKKINGKIILAALGQAFFSLSLGMSALITYGAYIKKKDNLSAISLQVVATDTLVAILAGMAIFPIVFSFPGLKPTSGPGLLFQVLPVAFGQMPFGYVFGILFFVLVVLAALTSAISLMEIQISTYINNFNINRVIATIIAFIISFGLGILIHSKLNLNIKILSIFGDSLIDQFDGVTTKVLIPIAAFFTSIFVGYRMESRDVLTQFKNKIWRHIFYFSIKIIVPLIVLCIFIFGIKDLL